MRTLIHIGCAVFILLSTVTSAVGGEIGRYQAFQMGTTGAPLIFVLDTAEGHGWAVTCRLSDGIAEGWIMLYMGQVRPGQKIGELIDSFTAQKPKGKK